MVTLKDELYGEDIDWLAADRNGYLAVMTQAVLDAAGPIPNSFQSLILIESVRRFIGNLSRITGAEMMRSMPRPDDYINFAERGLFSYDWRPLSLRYEIQSRPLAPVKMSDIDFPYDIRDALFHMSDICFAESMQLDLS